MHSIQLVSSLKSATFPNAFLYLESEKIVHQKITTFIDDPLFVINLERKNILAIPKK